MGACHSSTKRVHAAERDARARYRKARSRVGHRVGMLIWRWRQRPVASGLAPQKHRPDARRERQRLETLEIVSRHAGHIRAAAARHRVAAEAIVGAIVWEGLENPYRRPCGRLGPGKVRPIRLFQPTDAQVVEDERSVERSGGALRRLRRLRDPQWAIEYIAAILGHHADTYEALAGVAIREDVGVLCTLYQGGESERRALKFARGHADDPSARPSPGNDMGPWVARNIAFVSSLLPAESAADGTGDGRSPQARQGPRVTE